MRPRVDNAIIWLTIVAKNHLDQPGGEGSARLRLVGAIEHKVQRGTVTALERTHIPIEARGRLALVMDRRCEVGSSLWIFGEHREDRYIDHFGDEQHKLKILVNAFELDRKLDFSHLFRD